MSEQADRIEGSERVDGLDDALTSIAEILKRSGGELRALAAASEDLQNVVGHICTRNGAVSGESIYELQALDRLTQAISAIADFLEAVASQTPTDWEIDPHLAVDNLTLGDIADRLKGIAGNDLPSGAGPEASAGDCSFF